MLTIFSTPKPFLDRSNVIQRNALQSWTLLHPDVEVILFGDEQGAAEVCKELGIRHEPQVRKNEHGAKYLNDIFDRAQEIARHDILCYANCDIMLMSDFCGALERVKTGPWPFLMVGRRWNTEITKPWEFNQPDWEERLRALVRQSGALAPPGWMDYFVFSRGLYRQRMPAFLIGRWNWDPWLVWFARALKTRVVDASLAALAVHQNHDYAYHPDGPQGVQSGKEAAENQRLSGGGRHRYTTEFATEIATAEGVRPSHRHRMVLAKHLLSYYSTMIWFGLLDITRPVRHRLGIRKKAALARETHAP
jgi:hypothetical protein